MSQSEVCPPKSCSVCGSVNVAFRDVGRQCKPCLKIKDAERYERNRGAVMTRIQERYAENREQILAQLRAQYAENPAPAKQRSRDRRQRNPTAILTSRLKAKYGITLETFQTMLAAQGGVCKICKKPPARKAGRLSVDHNHATGRVRGLLCSNCNSVLGMADENIKTLQASINYLQEYEAA